MTSDNRWKPVPAQVDLPAMERDVLAFWDEHDTFAKSLDNSAGGEPWTFYEGPPTANGMPGTHHIEARVFKDLFPRYRTMKGYSVGRKAGWDCQGLHVEVGVEKELGLSGRRDIEAYGVAEFNARCRESVLRNVDAFEELTTRMGYWVNLDEAYRTMDPDYIDSVWWSLKQIFDKDLLVEDFRITPYCPRCGTGLSDHELGQPGAYETVADPSVYVRFPLTSGPLAGAAALLTWTTTPWTLVSNALVAARRDVTYVAATDGRETLVVAEPLLESVLGEGWTVTRRFAGSELAGWTYQRPFELVAWPDDHAHFVVLEDYVTTEDGTGLVHESPAHGEEDFRSCRENDVAMVNVIDTAGHFLPELDLVGGDFFKKADDKLVKDLEQRGLLFRHVTYEHAYPHCWRCHTPVLYYAVPAWYIRTTQIKDMLIAENERTNWFPESVKEGRYGDWLRNNVDWSLSRTRYWGTPLPIWRCAGGHLTCVGSRVELGSLVGRDLSDLDLHKPYVDEVTFACPTCREEARRVPDVIDAWYDSGAMPFAQWGYPWAEGSKERFETAYPAHFICEAIDQTRGWFYSLMAIGTLVFDRSAYQNVVCLGLLLAEDGRKMSKHLGNVVAPMPLMDRHGADAVRWFMACSGSPWAARRVGDTTINEVVRKVLLTYWNTVAFHALYARLADWAPGGSAPAVSERSVLDRWLASETHRLVRDCDAAYEAFDTQRLGLLIAQFVDVLSNWYVRRSRRRFWSGDAGALTTLHETLDALTRVEIGTLTPFVTERVWQDVVRPVTPGVPESVHLAAFPVYDETLVDDALATQMAMARRVVELGRSARAEAKVRTRQPLRRALVGSAAIADLDPELLAEIAEELNVGVVEPLSSAGADLVEYSAKGNFRELGKRFGKQTPVVAKAIADADAGELAAALRADGSVTLLVDDATHAVTSDEVLLSERPKEGWSVVNEQGETVALDLEVTPELRRAGLAREVVRTLQEARKSAGLEVSDRIRLWLVPADTDLTETLDHHADEIAREALATSLVRSAPDSADGLVFGEDPDLGLRYWLARA